MNRTHWRPTAAPWLVLACACALAACDDDPPAPAGQFTQQVSSVQLDGTAIDANTAVPRDTYSGQAAATATDGPTTASSQAATWQGVGGAVHAEPGPAPHDRDAATAMSLNKARSAFDVTTAGTFTFSMDVSVQGIRLTGQGQLTVQAQMTFFDAAGNLLRDPQGSAYVANHTVDVRLDANGNPRAWPGGYNANQPGQAVNGNAYSGTGSAQVPLPAGAARVEVELNLTAMAPLPAEDQPASLAHVDSATARIRQP